VFGNDPGEDCHDTDIDLSWCQQGWRWNLDRVVDTQNNQTRYFYTTETNHYLRWGNTKTAYDRAGALETIEYGLTRPANGHTIARQVVEIETGDRCVGKIQGGGTCAAGAGVNPWPDVPVDLICGAADTCTSEAPAFFTDQRYTKVTSKTVQGTQAGGLTTRVVDEYVLGHTMPEPDPAHPGAPELWLNTITRTGHGANGITTSLPAVA